MGATKAVESKSEDDREESEARDCERNAAVSARLPVLSVAGPYPLRPLLVFRVLLKPCCQHERQFFVFIVIASFIFEYQLSAHNLFSSTYRRLQALNPQNSALLLLIFCISSSFYHFWTLNNVTVLSLSTVHHDQFYIVLCSLYVTQFTTHRQVSLAFCPCLRTY